MLNDRNNPSSQEDWKKERVCTRASRHAPLLIVFLHVVQSTGVPNCFRTGTTPVAQWIGTSASNMVPTILNNTTPLFSPNNEQAILASYTAVGILEHWDLSMQLFDARVKSPVRSWRQIQMSNQGQLSGLRDEVLQWAHTSPEIHRTMATDLLLYEYAFSTFKLQTTASLGTVW